MSVPTHTSPGSVRDRPGARPLPIRLAALALGWAWCLIAAPAAAQRPLEIWHAMGGRAGAAVAEQCARFNAAWNGVPVRCLYQGSYERLVQKVVAAYRSGRQPGLVQLPDVAVRLAATSGAVLPLKALWPAEPAMSNGDDLQPFVRRWYAQADGSLFGQPYNVSTLVLYVNRSRLASVGVDRAPADWEALWDAAARLRDAGLACPFVSDLHAWRTLEQVLAVHGQLLARPDNGLGEGARVDLLQPLLRRHVHDLADGWRRGLLRLETQTRAGNMTASFRSGECALMLDTTGAAAGISAAAQGRFRVSVHPVPVYRGAERFASAPGGAALYALKGMDEAQTASARAFLRFVRGQDEQLRLAKATGFLPVTVAAAEAWRLESADTDAADNAIAVALRALMIPQSSPPLRLGSVLRLREVWKEALQQILGQGEPIDRALARAQARGDELERRFEATYREAAP